MRIAAQSASASVTRMLETLILRSGHEVARTLTDIDCLIEDTLHPAKEPINAAAKILLVDASAAQEGTLTCPLRPERLIQRLAALGTTQSIALSNGWSLDSLARSLQHESGSSAALTEKECSLLKQLAQSHPTPMGREALLSQVWGMQGGVDTHTLETHIYRLRAKLNELSPNPCDILTQNGAYTLVFAGIPV